MPQNRRLPTVAEATRELERARQDLARARRLEQEARRARTRALKDSLGGPALGQVITVRGRGKTITCKFWLTPVKRVADECLIDHLETVVSRLKVTLPIDTGRLRRSTKMIVYARDNRSFRVWSFAPYSKFVITAPPVWRRWARWLTSRLRACRGTVPLRCTVRQTGQPVRKATVKYKMRLSKLQPRALPYSEAALDNQIRGTYKPVNTLRADIRAAIRKELL